MSAWIKPVDVDAVSDGEHYFLGRNAAAAPFVQWFFDATDSKGRHIMSTKPGLANWFVGGEKLKSLLRDHPSLQAIPVPPDAHKRWKRRRSVL